MNVGQRILRASLVVMLAHVIFKFAGLVQFKALGHYCDPVTLDLFIFSFVGVLWTFYLIGEEGLGPAFLPVFMEAFDKKSERDAWRFASSVITVQVLVIAVVVSLVAAFPETVVRLFSDWDDPEALAAYMQRAPRMVRGMIPALFGLSVGSTTYLVLNGYKRFFLAAFGDSVVKFAIIAGVLASVATGGSLTDCLIAGVLVGGFAKVATHLLGLRRELWQLRPNLNLRTRAWRRFAFLVAPLLLGILFGKVRDVFNNIWVLSHTHEAGLVAYNEFGRKIFNAIGYLVPYSVSIAMYPFFCELVDREERGEMARLVTRSGQILWVLVVPVTALVVALSLPLARLIFQGGQFDLEAARLAATANACYTLVLPFFTLEYVFMQTFFSHRRMVTPIVLGLVFSTLSMVLSWLGVVAYGLTGAAAVAAVALAYALSRTLKTVSLGVLLRRFLPDLDGAHAGSFALRMAAAGLATGGAAYLARKGCEAVTDVYAGQTVAEVAAAVVPCLASGSVAGGAVYLAALRVLCPAEWREAVRWIRARLAARRAGR